MKADKFKETLVDEKINALVDMLDKTLAVVKQKTLCDTMGDVKAEVEVNMLHDRLAEVEANRLKETQLVETMANTLEEMHTKTLVAHEAIS